jgi:hypothetical protein
LSPFGDAKCVSAYHRLAPLESISAARKLWSVMLTGPGAGVRFSFLREKNTGASPEDL